MLVHDQRIVLDLTVFRGLTIGGDIRYRSINVNDKISI